MATILSDLLKPALRRGGITTRPGIIPNVDQYGELIPEVNRMLSSWNCDGHRIFTTSIDIYPLTAGQKIYTIGPGGAFNNPRPIFVSAANLIFPTTPVLRREIKILNDDEWSRISIQDISGALPVALYYDGGLNTSAGLANIYIVFQPPVGYSLELYTWDDLATSFTAVTDAALFPPGYEDAIVTNLALRVCALYPNDSTIAKNPNAMGELRDQARRALDALIILNTQIPDLRSEAASIGQSGGGYGLPWGWWLAP